MQKKVFTAFIFSLITLFSSHSQVLVTGSNGANGAYVTLKTAFDGINLQPDQLGKNIVVTIFASTTETATAKLTGSATTWMSINVNSSANVSVSGNIAGPLIELDNAQNLTLDGRLNGNWPAYSLTLENKNTTESSVIRFVNGASSNIVQHCVLKGASNSLTSATVFFSTGNTTSGNSHNIIQANNFRPTLGGRARINVLSIGASTNPNTHLQITDNHFINSIMKDEDTTNDVYGVLLSSHTTRCTVDRNHFYETGAFGVAAGNGSYSIIEIKSNGNDFRIADNYIGGSQPFCQGDAWEKSQFDNAFTAIKINTTVGGANNIIANNSIANINWSNSDNADFTAIYAGASTGATTTVQENSIGSDVGNNSIQYNTALSAGTFYGIVTNGNCVVNSNTIGSITASNLFNTNATNIIAIQKTTGNVQITNNTIGSETTANSIVCTSESTSNTQNIAGIAVDFTATNIVISGNKISYLSNKSTGNDGSTMGIVVRSSGNSTVEDNTISNLQNFNNNTTSNHSASLGGIIFVNSTARHIIRRNKIRNIVNEHPDFGGSIFGIYVTGTAAQVNEVSSNFITQLRTQSSTSSVYGIQAFSGNTLYANNIIVLGKNTNANIYGFFDTGSESQTCNLYHNTVYINGVFDDDLIAANSYAVYSYRNSNSRNYRNNIFFNARTNGLGIARHYAVLFNYGTPGALTLNYNDYLATGVGGFLGRYNGNVNTLPLISGQDAQSIMVNPLFDNQDGNNAQDYGPIAGGLDGITIANVATDYNNKVRATIPTMGAIERLPNKWKGAVNSNWAVAANWTRNVVLSPNDDLIFDNNPQNHCTLDTDKSVGTIVNNQSNYRVVLNAQKLTVKGELQLSNGAQIDATSALSNLEFAGNTSQALPANALWLNQVYNLTINNAQHLVLYGTLHLTNELSAINGRLNAITQSPTLHYSGNSLQTINANQLLNETVFELHINNDAGVKLNTPLLVAADMTIETAAKLEIAAAQTLKVDGTLTNNAGVGGLLLASNASGTASLLHNSNNVPAKVERYFDGAATEWHFISTPVTGQALDNVWKHAGSYGDGTGYDLYAWDEPSACWIYNLNTTVAPTWTSVHAGNNFIPAKGYLYATQQLNPTRTFEGSLNNGTHTVALSTSGELPHKGFNLVGNPYPSSIDWKSLSGYTRNMLVLNGGGYDIWTWSNTANNYGVYNSADPTNVGTNNVSRYIAPMQAFYVRANTVGNLEFANAARTHLGANNWRKAPSLHEKPQMLSVKISSPEGLGTDEIRIVSGRAQQAGALKMFSSVATAPSVYLPFGEQKHSIFYIDAFNEKNTFDVAFKAGKKAQYTFDIEISDQRFSTVYVYDRQLNQTHSLQNGQNFSFEGAEKDAPQRFTVYFDQNKTNPDALEALLFQSSGTIGIDLSQVALGAYRCEIVDMKGIKIKDLVLNSGEIHSISITEKGIFVVNIHNGNKHFKKKIIL